MLVALELLDFAIVDALQVAFAPGLNVLTGETGAGKSIVVDALTLLLGGRAEARAVRSGAPSALVQGFFGAEVGLDRRRRRNADAARAGVGPEQRPLRR